MCEGILTGIASMLVLRDPEKVIARHGCKIVRSTYLFVILDTYCSENPPSCSLKECEIMKELIAGKPEGKAKKAVINEIFLTKM